MKLEKEFRVLGQKQYAIQDGLSLLQEVRSEMQRNRAKANLWGNLAVVANLVILPLNIVINAFQAKQATSAFRRVVQIMAEEAYKNHGASGTRLEGNIKPALEILKTTLVQYLTSRRLIEYIPGVNMIVGMAEDSIALYQVANEVDRGGSEMKLLERRLDRQIQAATRELVNLGVRRAQILERVSKYDTIA